jgi:hypothetical protein
MSERAIDSSTKAAIQENVVRLAVLVYADFPAGEIYLWTGVGTLFADGHDWQGVGSLLSFEDITESVDTAQNGMSVRLSGIPSDVYDHVVLADYQNRRAYVALVVFDEYGQAVGPPVMLFRGLMDSDTVKDTGQEVSITITMESAMSDQLRPRIFRYTHEDQQTRFPDEGDKGLEYVAALQDLQLRWGEA